MDQEVLVRQLRDVVTRLEQNEGPVALFLLEAPDTGFDNIWNVIVSSPAFDHVSKREAIGKIVDYLRSSLDKSLWYYIERATVLRTDDPFVVGMIRRARGLGPGDMLQQFSVAGIEISSAIVVEAKKLAA
jgi:hypothetical protein